MTPPLREMSSYAQVLISFSEEQISRRPEMIRSHGHRPASSTQFDSQASDLRIFLSSSTYLLVPQAQLRHIRTNIDGVLNGFAPRARHKAPSACRFAYRLVAIAITTDVNIENMPRVGEVLGWLGMAWDGLRHYIPYAGPDSSPEDPHTETGFGALEQVLDPDIRSLTASLCKACFPYPYFAELN
ncbi:hypothetical protein N431DRAFT_443236 [Stipitochalara longipes BDJ]|nr:hypothetical protein N431DRAFT_443236 [Stipitochalara longipes BDJ]